MSKVKLIAVTKAPVSDAEYEDTPIVMVNVNHITTVEEWGNLGTKLTLLNGEHLIVKENQDEVLEFIDECNDEQ